MISLEANIVTATPLITLGVSRTNAFPAMELNSTIHVSKGWVVSRPFANWTPDIKLDTPIKWPFGKIGLVAEISIESISTGIGIMSVNTRLPVLSAKADMGYFLLSAVIPKPYMPINRQIWTYL